MVSARFWRDLSMQYRRDFEHHVRNLTQLGGDLLEKAGKSLAFTTGAFGVLKRVFRPEREAQAMRGEGCLPLRAR